MKSRTVGQAVLALAVRAEKRRMRRHQREIGWPTEREQVLYAEQRRRDLPPGHPYA